MNNYDLVLTNATVINAKGDIYNDYTIGITNGLIKYFGQNQIKGLQTINCYDKVVTPSLANGHVHSPMNILKGIAEDVNIDDWFNLKIWPYESSMNKKDVQVGAQLAIYEMINNGVTVFADHYFMEDEIIKAVKQTGIRIDLAPTIFSGPDFEKRISKTLQLNELYKDDNKITISWGPHSTYLCTFEDLATIAKLSSENKMKIHLHIGETKKQLNNHIKKFNETPMETLKKAGILENKLILAHSLQFEKTDLNLFSSKHFVALCPKTYAKLAMDAQLMIENLHNFNWGFGTDGAASSNNLDLIEQARIFGLLTKYSKADATTLQAKKLWQHLMNTHKAFDFNTGDIGLNRPADLIIWDLNKINTLPNHNIISSIIYSSTAQNIESVLVNGRFLKQNYKVLRLDKAFIENVGEQRDRLLAVGTSKTDLKF